MFHFVLMQLKFPRGAVFKGLEEVKDGNAKYITLLLSFQNQSEIKIAIE